MTILTNSKRGLSLEWTKHLKSEAEKKEFIDAVRHDTLVLGRLADIIQEKLQGLQNRETSPSEYDNPSWAYKQAHTNGLKLGLTSILSLLPRT